MPFRTRVKICGITRPDDAYAAIENGADALGFVFYDKSPRSIEIQKAEILFSNISPFINKVVLFVNPDYDYVNHVLSKLPVDLLQFHGDEDEVFCSSFNKPYLKAIRMRNSINLDEVADTYHSASGLLLDAFDSSQYGGTGQTFDWDLIPKKCKLPIVLAGGLNPSNVSKAIQNTNVFAVDVSSGVEKSKGVKDHQLIKQFMQEVKRANE
ncbi:MULTISPECIES: phosphoribosylanthranilate isomerase [Cycloclasticus]|uniref:N-(5'-phosphoribosyl)anthranilate isomerase n=1 Tax=Cycloclasticus pugetii TaxID=34068 RepID=A0AB33Z0P0_9GAMM|nr:MULTISPECIES: phosphoribosylanthranilate isomerase [Cycloclasticus]ATI03279.1 phosphoribosylanthranilate isomerase [Cycloclasticus sp. PY97N]EPD12724.1 N-(5'-phosphoribosyl)anthranilate isomerase [Cycloclasticus pugetii]